MATGPIAYCVSEKGRERGCPPPSEMIKDLWEREMKKKIVKRREKEEKQSKEDVSSASLFFSPLPVSVVGRRYKTMQ